MVLFHFSKGPSFRLIENTPMIPRPSAYDVEWSCVIFCKENKQQINVEYYSYASCTRLS